MNNQSPAASFSYAAIGLPAALEADDVPPACFTPIIPADALESNPIALASWLDYGRRLTVRARCDPHPRAWMIAEKVVPYGRRR